MALVLVGLLVFAPVARAEDVLKPGVRLWVDPHSSTRAAADRLSGADRENALKLATVPSATWLTGGDALGGRRGCDAARGAGGRRAGDRGL